MNLFRLISSLNENLFYKVKTVVNWTANQMISRGIKVNQIAQICLILEVKFGDDP